MANVNDDVVWTAPGPGSWEMDHDHIARPMFGVLGEVFAGGFPAGMAMSLKDHGFMLESFHVAMVNGFPFIQVKPVGAPAGGDPPPAFMLRIAIAVLTRVHPELRRRMKTASTLFADRPWRSVVARWQSTLLAATIERHRDMDSVDVGALDDAALARHVIRLREYAIATLTQDHSMNLSVMLPIGDYLTLASSWTGLPPSDLMQVLRGSSDISRGEFAERRRLIDALRATNNGDARALLLDDKVPPLEVWRKLAAWPGDVGEAMRAFRLICGNTITHGITICSPSVDEEPGAVVRALRASLSAPQQREQAQASRDDDLKARVAALRARVPAQHHAMFDVVVEDALLVNRLRDERHIYGALPMAGIARRVLLEVGRRAHARGALADASLALFAGTDELCALADPANATYVARGAPRGLDALAQELARRKHLHAVLDAGKVPASFGPIDPPPPAEWMPNEGARRSMRALNAYIAQPAERKQDTDQSTSAVSLSGLAVSRGVHEGTARLCASAADLDRVRDGDVLIASTTTSAINIVLPILGAIVTDRGGALSHAAIVTREYGIPGVVGTRFATKQIPDGARVRVDGDAGVVTVLG